MNLPVGFMLLFVIDDALYYVWHRTQHVGVLYKWINKVDRAKAERRQSEGRAKAVSGDERSESQKVAYC